ncbi:hypothetical protein B0H63DRAFT_103742 [Podospora didyma]|uniref:Carboxymethylenebutenolidase n=1 Tax=Podospora didyma TaxID=330526 RepID=A0AAE0NY46_9PEZI|nr:hypothetical protein B0H63DRAFT_103742 [Podospora didyma]
MSLTLPTASPIHVAADISVQTPLSRRGTGPGLILVVADDIDLSTHSKTLDPPPLRKWAEEGYAVGQILLGTSDVSALSGKIGVTLAELERLDGCDSVDKVGIIVISTEAPASLLNAITSHPNIVASVFYGCHPATELSIPVLCHLPKETQSSPEGQTPPTGKNTAIYKYPATAGSFFTIPAHNDYRASSAPVAHTRSLSFLKPLMGGQPFFDLEAIWEEHTRLEFADRDVEATMATMVAEPYVNHVPTLTGGVGRKSLTSFYRDHFIFSNADDAALELVSRTVGVDRIVDEFLFNCTHDRVIDWLIPGIPPTFRSLTIPFTGIVNIRGDRLYHEHIAWDQGTVLRQLGLLPEYLPFPYPVPGVDDASKVKNFEYRVPVAGAETAQKLLDENAVASNEMLQFAVREVRQ